MSENLCGLVYKIFEYKKGRFLSPDLSFFLLLQDICSFYHQVAKSHFVIQTVTFRVRFCVYHVTVDFQFTHACTINGVSSCRHIIGFAVGRDNEGTFFHVFRFLPKHFFVAVGIVFDDAIGEFLLAIVFLMIASNSL